MNRKSWIIVILLVHLIVHPLTHAITGSPVHHGTAISNSGDASSTTDECGLCRAMSALTLFVLLAMLVAPRTSTRRSIWAPRTVSLVGLLSELPSRAPPVFA